MARCDGVPACEADGDGDSEFVGRCVCVGASDGEPDGDGVRLCEGVGEEDVGS